MSKYIKFLCDIYQDDELLHEQVEAEVYIGDFESRKKNRFKDAAEDAVEEKCLEKIERDYVGITEEFRVIVTEIDSNEKRVVIVEPEATVEFNFNAIEEQELAQLERHEQ